MANPKTFQQLLNNMLPPKVVDGITYVLRITQASGGEIQTFFASRDGRQHGGIDVLYGRLNTTSSKVDSVGSKEALNQNVLIGAPVDGVLRIVTERSGSKLAIVAGTDGVEYVIRHMSNLPGALDGQTVRAGTVIGTMSNVGMNGGAVHDHLSAYTYAPVDGQVQRVAVDPYTLYKNNFDYSKTDMILLKDQKGVGYSTVGRYIPSELVDKDERNPALNGVYQYDNTTPLKSTPIGGIQAFGEYLRGLESGGDYTAVNKFGALGAYQMLPDALQQAKLQNANGTWTGKDGVWSKEDFLSNKTAQDNAFASNYESVKAQLKSNGAWTKIGETMTDGTVLTEASLIGAGWLGAGNVGNYFKTDGAFNRADANGASVAYRLRSFSRFDPSLPDNDAVASSPPAAAPLGGHWEYPPTSYNAMEGFVGASERVWVADKPATTSTGTATSSNPPSSTTSTSTPSANTPYPTNSTTTHHKPEYGGGITVNFTVLKTSPNGAMLKGDLVTYVQDADGKTTYQSLRRTVGKETTLTEQVKDSVTGDVINTKSVWRGNGPDSLQFQEQRDGAQNLVGPRYVKDGEAYNRSEGVGGAAAWLNERGQSEQEWKLDPTNSSGVNSVNGLDSQSDNYVAPQELSFYRLTDDDIAQIRQGAQNILASADNTSYTVAGGGIQTDGGVITGYGSGDAGPGGSASSASDPLNFANLSPTQLAQALQSSSTGGAYGAGQMDGNSFVPISATSKVLTNSQGEVIGEANLLPNGYTRFTDPSGNVAYTNPNGQALSEQAYQSHQLGLATAGAGLAQSIIGLQNWDKQTTLGQVGTVVGMYNNINTLSEGALGSGSGLGSLGSLGAGLGFLSALESGDAGRSVYSGLILVDTLTATAGAVNSGMISASMGGNFLPGVNLVLALSTGDPISILAAAVAFIPVYGQILSIAITILGGLLGGGEPERPAIPDTPMSEGYAHAQWDAAGNTQVVTDQDSFGGGATATAWMNHLTGALQTRLQSYTDAEGNGYGLVANMLPSIGYQFDPDRERALAQPGDTLKGDTAQLILRWVDEQGNPQHRNYDHNGKRADGSTIAGDFMKHAQGAIAPNWQVQTVLAHYQQGQGINLPTLKEGLPQALANGLQQSLQAITLDLPTEGINQQAEDQRLAELDYQNALAQQDKLIDIDGDGYLEQTQWLANNQAVLSIDANGNSQIDAGELLSLSGAGLNALNWLDANGDQRVDARDPAFAALRLWIDINSDSNSQGETQTLTQAGIVAIDFGSNPPQIIRADNSSSTLTVQTLTGDILGVNYQSITGGVLQQDEQRNADGTLAGPVQTLHAINTRLFDGQAGHINGGVAVATALGSHSTVDAGDSRLSSTSARTIANQSLQINAMLGVGDARLQSAPSSTLRQAQGERIVSAAQVRSNGIAFIPMGTTSAAQEQRQATEAMIRSAESGLFGTAGGGLPLAAMGVGAAAVQWPTVAGAQKNTGSGSQVLMATQTSNDGGGDGGGDGGDGGDDNASQTTSFGSSSSQLVFADSGSTPGSTQSTQTPQNTSNTVAPNQFEASNQALAQQIQAQAATKFIAANDDLYRKSMYFFR